jgi:capreomycidine synthase
MNLPKAKLEYWMRDYYFSCSMDLGSSGVYPYSFKDICRTCSLDISDLNDVLFEDGPTIGSFELRKALADRYNEGNADCVMTANGSNEMLYHLLSTLLNAGDEIVALDTIYHALDAVPIAKNCRIKRWQMKENRNFRVEMSELRDLITRDTKLIAVNFPHNPTGVSISQNEQNELIDIARSVDAYLIWDAAFEEIVPNGLRLKNPFLAYDKAISVGTFSKSFGMPGLRVGWCFASKDVIQKCVQLRDYTTLYVSPLIELVAAKVIHHADSFVNNRLDAVAGNRKLLERWVSENKDTVTWSAPMGGVCCLIKIPMVDDMDEFCKALAKKYGVMLVPGSCFGLSEYARLGFGESPTKFEKGLEYMSMHLQEYLDSAVTD